MKNEPRKLFRTHFRDFFKKNSRWLILSVAALLIVYGGTLMTLQVLGTSKATQETPISTDEGWKDLSKADPDTPYPAPYKEFNVKGTVVHEICHFSGKCCKAYTLGIDFWINKRHFIEEFKVSASQKEYWTKQDSVPMGLVIRKETKDHIQVLFTLNDQDYHSTTFDKRRKEYRQLMGWEE